MSLRPHQGERVPTRDGGQVGMGLLPLLLPNAAFTGESHYAPFRAATGTTIVDAFITLYTGNRTTAYNALML